MTRERIVILQDLILKDRLKAIQRNQKELKDTLSRMNNPPSPPAPGGHIRPPDGGSLDGGGLHWWSIVLWVLIVLLISIVIVWIR